MTNLEKIKQMSVEETATLMNNITFCCQYDECKKCPLNSVRGDDYRCSNASIERWLESEAE